jgi:hypothetical protein
MPRKTGGCTTAGLFARSELLIDEHGQLAAPSAAGAVVPHRSRVRQLSRICAVNLAGAPLGALMAVQTGVGSEE